MKLRHLEYKLEKLNRLYGIGKCFIFFHKFSKWKMLCDGNIIGSPKLRYITYQRFCKKCGYCQLKDKTKKR